MATKFRTRFGARKVVQVDFSKSVNRTKSNFADECDVNKIMSRYSRTGQLPNLRQRDAAYGDFSEVQTYQESMQVVLHAQAQFAALPANVRAECGNDPAVFLARVQDEDFVERHKLALKGTPLPPADPAPSAPKKAPEAPAAKSEAKADA